MKNIIMKYYNFSSIDDYKIIRNKFYFEVEGDKYIFEPVYNVEEFNYIYNIVVNKCDQILKNIYNSHYTNINDINYVLIKRTTKFHNILDNIQNTQHYFGNRSVFDKYGWINLWQKKLDYYEYQQKHIDNYSYISESFNYYLGMGETSIAYIRYNISTNNIPLVLSHKRINDDYYNPLNFIFDYKARDVSGYLKYLFLNNKYCDFDIDSFLKKINFNRVDFILLYGRLLFPSFYFDLYDDIINNAINQKKIKSIIIRSDEYEKFLKIIYDKINGIVMIPGIDWLN